MKLPIIFVVAGVALATLCVSYKVARSADPQGADGRSPRARTTPAPDVDKIIALISAMKDRQFTMNRSETATRLREVLSWDEHHVVTEEERKSGKASLFFKVLGLKAEGETGRKFVDDLHRKLDSDRSYSLDDSEFGMFYTETINPQALEILLRLGLQNADPGVYLEVGEKTAEAVTFKLFQIPADPGRPSDVKIESIVSEGGTVVGAPQLQGVAIPVGRPLLFNATRKQGTDFSLSLKASDGSLVSVIVRGKSDREAELEKEVVELKAALATMTVDRDKWQKLAVSYQNATYVAHIYKGAGYGDRRGNIGLGSMTPLNDAWDFKGPRAVGLNDTAKVYWDVEEGKKPGDRWKFEGDNGPHSIIIEQIPAP
jgi:hypothetical protein